MYKFSKKKKIGFLLSVFDIKSSEIFKKIKLDFIKVPSGEIKNLPLLLELKKYNLPMILSTGMSDLKEIKLVKKKLNYKKKLIFLHCNSSYPSQPSELNLVIQILHKN